MMYDVCNTDNFTMDTNFFIHLFQTLNAVFSPFPVFNSNLNISEKLKIKVGGQL